MSEYLMLLCLTVVQGTPIANQFAKERSGDTRHGTKTTVPLEDNLQMATSNDQKEAATGHGHEFGGLGHGGHGNGYFQYAHNPDYGHYEFGYRRGNDHHFQERYEKAHDWKFKTKVKWGDKYGGYGEHYWDYNHVDKGYGGDHGHGGSGGEGGYGSEHLPVVVPDGGGKNSRIVQKRESKQKRRVGKESKLSLDPISGKVTDEVTGRTYWLQPTTATE